MKYVVIASRAKMPSSCWGGHRYLRVALIEALDGADVKIIRDTKTQRVIRVWGPVYEGKTERCGARRAIREAERMADELARGGSGTTGT